MILHTLASPHLTEDCLSSAQAGDTVLLIGDGVYGAIAASEAGKALKACEARVLVLASDALAAGLEQDALAFPATDMAGFVALTEYYPRQLAWY